MCNIRPHLSPLLVMLLLAPCAGLAGQAEAPSDPVPLSTLTQEPEEEPARMPYYDPYAPPVRERPHVVLRLLAEAGLGLVTSVPGAVAGLGLGVLACKRGVENCNAVLASSFAVATSTAFSLGVMWAGSLMGMEGRPLAALSGPLLLVGGSLLVGTLGALRGGSFIESFANGAVVLFYLNGLCSLLLYELTMPDEAQGTRSPPRAVSRRPAGPRLQPTLALSSQGALVGLGGSF